MLPLIALIIIGFLVVLILPPIILAIFPYAKLLFQIAMIFMIYVNVKTFIGEGPMSLIISGILIYFLVFKYTAITASLWVFQLLLGLQFFSVIIWGIATQMRPHGAQS